MVAAYIAFWLQVHHESHAYWGNKPFSTDIVHIFAFKVCYTLIMNKFWCHSSFRPLTIVLYILSWKKNNGLKTTTKHTHLNQRNTLIYLATISAPPIFTHMRNTSFITYSYGLTLRDSYNKWWSCALVGITPAPFLCRNSLTLEIIPENWQSSFKIVKY